MEENKLSLLPPDDLPQFIDELYYDNYLLEKEFEFFKKICDIYLKVNIGHFEITIEKFTEIFNSENYWDIVYDFKEAFESQHHYFYDKLFDVVSVWN